MATLTGCSYRFRISEPGPGPRGRVQDRGELQLARRPRPKPSWKLQATPTRCSSPTPKSPADMIKQLKSCRIISRFGIGVDNVDIAAATGKGIVVTKVPDYCIDEVSDHAMALLLALVRKIPFANARVQAGRWEMPSWCPFIGCAEHAWAWSGFGRIPQLVAPKAQAIRVAGGRLRSLCSEGCHGAGRRGDRWNSTSWSRSPTTFPFTAPLTPETHHLFNAEVFGRMKPRAYLVNTARGPLIDEAALAQALDKRPAAGAALDVVEKEPPPVATAWPGQRDPDAAYGFLFRRVSAWICRAKRPKKWCGCLAGRRRVNPVNPEALKAAARLANII